MELRERPQQSIHIQKVKTMRKYLFVFFLILMFAIIVNVVDASQVRVIHFTPNNRTQQDIRASLDTQIKAVQNLYANQMYAHGYGNKTFQIETDREGMLIVHHLAGTYTDAYYHTDTLRKVHSEVNAYFDTGTAVYAIFVDVSTERIQDNCGIAYFEGGPAMFPATGDCIEGDAGVSLIAHELGHAFNLVHDFRSDAYIMSYGGNRNQLSTCAASMLSISSFFNQNKKERPSDKPASIEMLSPSTYTKNDTDFMLRFRINDIDGIHQVQFSISVPDEPYGLVNCQSVDDSQNATVDFQMPAGATISPVNNIYIRVIDQNSYTTAKEWAVHLQNTTPAETTNDYTYLTLNYKSPDALVPTNKLPDWVNRHLPSGNRLTWEKTPDGLVARRPHGFMDPAKHIPFMNEWDHWFYAHAESRIVYDLSGGDYAKFDAYFDMPNPCGSIASVKVTCLADKVEIYNSGVLWGHQTRNIPISFDIPANTETLTFNVTDAGDGDACDHFIFANARLSHRIPTTVDVENLGMDDSRTDVNRDGVVNLVDLVMVASRYGERITGDPTPNPDVNRDGIVDINDLILITNEMPVGFYTVSTISTYPNSTLIELS